MNNIVKIRAQKRIHKKNMEILRIRKKAVTVQTFTVTKNIGIGV